MASPKNRPPCPNCGGTRQITQGSAWANEQTIPVQPVRCEDCHYHGVQALIWLPPETSINALDEDRRIYQRLLRRQQREQLAQLKPLVDRRGRRITSDTLEITVRLIPGRLQSGLSKRIAALRRRRSTPIEEEIAS